MRQRGQGILPVLACIPVVLLCCRTAYAIKMEPNGPGYCTDTHGATGVLMSLLVMADDHPEVRPFVHGTVNWLYNVRLRENGACAWKISTTAPRGHPSSKVSYLHSLLTLKVFAEVNKKWPNDRITEMLREGMVMLKARTKKAQTQSGRTWGLLGSPRGRLRGNGSGRSGPAGVMAALAELFLLTNNKDVGDMTTGVANLLKDEMIASGEDGRTLGLWYFQKADRRWQTSWCYGTAGTSWAFMTAYEARPDHRFYDNTSCLDLADAGLNWLMTKAVEEDGRITWPHLRAPVPSENPGMGSGAAGVGAAFLRAYQLNRDIHPDLAALYLDTAAKTMRAIAVQINGGWDYLGKSHVVQDGVTEESLNLGLCGGIGGTGMVLIDFIKVIETQDPKLAHECRRACERLAMWYLERAIPFRGGRAWFARDKFGGEKTLNIALDYGLTGMVWCVHALAAFLEDPEIQSLEDDALKALLALAVKEDDGYKWPLFTDLQAEVNR